MAEASRASKLDSFQEGHVAANANLLILGGHETTASALAYASYLLALHPEVQERLAEEIDNYLQEHPVRYCFIWLYMSCTLTIYMITNCTVLHNIYLSFCMQTQCSIMWERVVLQYQLYNRVGTLPTLQMLSECFKSPEEDYSIWPTRATPPPPPLPSSWNSCSSTACLSATYSCLYTFHKINASLKPFLLHRTYVSLSCI